jgi:hypothetical protein
MSNAAYARSGAALRTNRTVRTDIQALRRRANLSLVRPGARQAGTLPFLLTIGVMLIGGLVGLLMFNTSMQNVAFAQNSLQAEATNLAAQQQALDLQLNNLDNPQHLASRARRLGMVIPQTVAMIKVPTGKMLGTPTPANGDATPNLWVPNPKPYYPAAKAPTTTTTVAKSTPKSGTTTTTKAAAKPTAKTPTTSTTKKPAATH